MLLAFGSKASLCCSCIRSEDYSIRAEFKSTDVVFLGYRIKIDTAAVERDWVIDVEIWYTFQVTQLYKGKTQQKTLRIRSGSIGADDCKFVFSVGESYVVYANQALKEESKKDKSILRTSVCTNTGRATDQKVFEAKEQSKYH